MKTQVFLQSEFLDDIEVIELDKDAGAAELRAACLAAIRVQMPAEEVFLSIEDIDEDDAINKMGRIPEGLRVHLHRLKGLDVIVRYAGRDVRRTFRPSATIARVKKWAAQELGISASDAAELMLQIAGTSQRPDADVHLGSLVKAPARSITFDLVPAPRVQG